jgi:PIN domain nuclease of toxin-antitoxin system
VEAVIYLDTHAAVWLYSYGSEAPFSERAREALRAARDLRISPMVHLEVEYLFEIGRITIPASEIHAELSSMMGLRLCDAPLTAVAQAAASQKWTRNPFDRMIVGHASLHDAPLITRDRLILENYPHALW